MYIWCCVRSMTNIIWHFQFSYPFSLFHILFYVISSIFLLISHVILFLRLYFGPSFVSSGEGSFPWFKHTHTHIYRRTHRVESKLAKQQLSFKSFRNDIVSCVLLFWCVVGLVLLFVRSFIHSTIHSANCLCHFSFPLSILLLSISPKCFGVDGILLVYLSYVFLSFSPFC